MLRCSLVLSDDAVPADTIHSQTPDSMHRPPGLQFIEFGLILSLSSLSFLISYMELEFLRALRHGGGFEKSND